MIAKVWKFVVALLRRLQIWSLDRSVRRALRRQAEISQDLAETVKRLKEEHKRFDRDRRRFIREAESHQAAQEAAQQQTDRLVGRYQEEIDQLRARLKIAEEVVIADLVAHNRMALERWDAETAIQAKRRALSQAGHPTNTE